MVVQCENPAGEVGPRAEGAKKRESTTLPQIRAVANEANAAQNLKERQKLSNQDQSYFNTIL